MKSLYIFLFVLIVLTRSAHALTVPGTNTGAIPDGTGSNGCGTARNIAFTVSGARIPTLATSVSFTGTHTYIGDLQVILIAPNASQFVLFSYVGRQNLTGDFGDDSDINGTYAFQDSSLLNIWTAAAGVNAGIVPPGTYRTQAAGPSATDSPGPAFTSLVAWSSTVPNPNGVWTLRFLDCAAVDTGTITAASLILVGPTAAPASISGRVVSSTGRGIGGARITVSGQGLSDPIVVMTNPFGYFKIAAVSSGQTYIMSVSSKQAAFSVPSKVITVNDDVTELEFVADP